ncbi:MAG: HAD family phosphatase [Fimbriimonadaceae bacterium]|nr:HAD family phosphatase [Fimbriimonadaceae bacterium]
MPPPRLIAVDLDGTLLTPDRLPHPRSVEALLEAQGKGVSVVLASGRALRTIQPIASETGIHGPIVSANGAYVVASDETVVVDECLSPSIVEGLIALAQNQGVHVNGYTASEVLMSKAGYYHDLYRERTGLRDSPVVGYEGMQARPLTKLLYFAEPEVIESLLPELSKMSKGGAEIVRSEADYVEFLPYGITKGTGLTRLADSMGIVRTEVAAIGDYYNDWEMLEWAGYSGAMAGAPADIRAKVDFVAPSNVDGGVADFVASAMNLERVL